MIEYPHGCERGADANDVADKGCREVGQLQLFDFGEFVGNALIDIEFEAQCYENARDDDVSEPKHTKLLDPLVVKVWEQQFDRDVKFLSNCDHHISAIDPEYIIEEQEPKQKESNLEASQVNIAQCHDTKQHTKNIVQCPVFGNTVEDNRDGHDDSADDRSGSQIEIFNLEQCFDELGRLDSGQDSAVLGWERQAELEQVASGDDCSDTELNCEQDVHQRLAHVFIDQVEPEEEGGGHKRKPHCFLLPDPLPLFILILILLQSVVGGSFEFSAHDDAQVDAAAAVDQQLHEDRQDMQEPTDVGGQDEHGCDGPVQHEYCLGFGLGYGLLLCFGFAHACYYLYMYIQSKGVRVTLYYPSIYQPTSQNNNYTLASMPQISKKYIKILRTTHQKSTAIQYYYALNNIIGIYILPVVQLLIISLISMRVETPLESIHQQSTPARNSESVIGKILAAHLPGYSSAILELVPLCGCTNEVYKVISDKYVPVVFRYLSPIVDRDVEGKIIIELSEAGIIPKCYYTCATYRIDQCVINANHPQPKQILANHQILKAVVRKAESFHKIKIPAEIPHIDLIEQMFGELAVKKYQEALPHPSYDAQTFKLLKNELLEEITPLKEWFYSERNFQSKNHTIKFCHNDLNNLNIFIRELGGDGNYEAIFIDFDYISYNYIAYDLANMLNETCIEYNDVSPGFEVKRKLTKSDITLACSYYPGKYEGMENDVQKMLVMVNYYWALWSILIKPTSANSAFSPLKHGLARWELVNYYKNQAEQI